MSDTTFALMRRSMAPTCADFLARRAPHVREAAFRAEAAAPLTKDKNNKFMTYRTPVGSQNRGAPKSTHHFRVHILRNSHNIHEEKWK